MAKELAQQMYDALNGKHPDRKDVKVEAEYGGNHRETISCSPYTFDTHCLDPKIWKSIYNPGVRLFDKGVLEAIVLIPEDAGQAKVKRIYWGGAAAGGFLTPEYTEEALQALIDAYSRKFADEGDVYEKSWMVHPISTMLPNEMKRFAQHRDRIINGLKNAHFEEGKGHKRNDAALDNLAGFIREMGISHATDKDFIQAFWQKTKENPNGYIGTGAWGLVADYIMQNNPQMVIESDRLRKGVAQASLPQLLWAIPVNQKADDRARWIRGNLPEKIYAPIFEAIEKTITE